MAPPSKRTKRRRQRFLESLKENANVSDACRRTNVTRTFMYDWRKDDPELAKEWDDAFEIGLDALEDEALRRGLQGYDETTFEPTGDKDDDGKPVLAPTKRVRKYSDTMLMFMLNGRRGHVFKSRHEHSGPGGGPISTVQRTIVDPADKG